MASSDRAEEVMWACGVVPIARPEVGRGRSVSEWASVQASGREMHSRAAGREMRSQAAGREMRSQAAGRRRYPSKLNHAVARGCADWRAARRVVCSQARELVRAAGQAVAHDSVWLYRPARSGQAGYIERRRMVTWTRPWAARQRAEAVVLP